MPFPSTGCQPCRKLKVKCDETKPVCQRCAKSRRACHGAREAFSVVNFENSYASGQKKRPRGPRSIPKIKCASQVYLPLARSPEDVTAEALIFFRRSHLERLEEAPTIIASAVDDLLFKWDSKVECPILDLAISSLALAVFSQSKGYLPAAVEAGKQYHALLQVLQSTLPSLNLDNIESCLLAIMFLGLYEDSMYRPRIGFDTSYSEVSLSFHHVDGALAILKFWKDRLSPTHPVTSAIKHARRGTFKYALIRNIALPDWIEDGASFGEHGLDLEYDAIIVRTVSARQKLSSLLKYNHGAQSSLQDPTSVAQALIEETQDIDQRLQDWVSHFPSTWAYGRHTLPNVPLRSVKDFYSPVIYSFQSPAYAAIWMRYFCGRMLINSTQLSVLEVNEALSLGLPSPQSQQCLSNVKAMAEGFASTLPCCLERFTLADIPGWGKRTIVLETDKDIKTHLGGIMVMPLTIASGIGHVEVKLSLWFRSWVVELGRVLGYRVFESALTDGWLKF